MIDTQFPVTPENILNHYRSLEVRMLNGSIMTGADLMVAKINVCFERRDDGWYEIRLPKINPLSHRTPEP